MIERILYPNTTKLTQFVYRKIGPKMWQFWCNHRSCWIDDKIIGGDLNDATWNTSGPDKEYSDIVMSYDDTWAEPCEGT